jgi:hypothetical protein
MHIEGYTTSSDSIPRFPDPSIALYVGFQALHMAAPDKFKT